MRQLYFFVSKVLQIKNLPFYFHLSKFQYSKQHNLNLQELLLNMPRNTKHTTELKKQRQKLKIKAQKYVPGIISLQVLGSGAKGAPRALYVFTDQSRYLFNCGEGTQRLAHEHKMKLSKLEHIFITKPSWENIGGLPGVALTIQDVGVPEITIHGPTGTDEIFTATQRFVVLKDLSVKMADCSAGGYFEDPVMTVHYIPIVSSVLQTKSGINGQVTTSSLNESKNTSSQEESDDDVDYYAHERNLNKRTRSRDRSSEYKRQKLDIKPLEAISISYICRLKPRAGALCLERCVDKGVPPGPLLGKLKNGEDVTLPDGTLVRSSDVCLPDDPGPVFLVVDCPSADYVDSLVNDPALKRHQADASSNDDIAYLIVHFTPPGIVKDPRYIAWMKKFSPSTYQLMINESNTCMGSIAVHRVQHKLHMLHPKIFPLLQDKGIPSEDLDVEEQNGNIKINSGSEVAACSDSDLQNSKNIDQMDISLNKYNIFSLIQAKTFCNFNLRPLRRLDREGELKLTPKQFVEETTCEEGFPEVLTELKQKLLEIKTDQQQKFPQILFLGTGSCIPNKTRNTSGILIHTSEDECILLDCGEGTYGQLVRFYGPDEANSVLRKLQAVFVSHLHADHHIGLVGLLKGRRNALQAMHKPLFLLAPKQIMSWLNFYHRCFEPIQQEFVLVPNSDLDMDKQTIDAALKSQLMNLLHMLDVRTVLVQHCPNAFGIAMKHVDGWKLTYSGDTMPCDRLVQLGKDSDLLIHEATMEDELIGEARLKMHSTTSQAIEIGKLMRAKFTLLTHFSQRYAKIPKITSNFTSDVGIAFDNMQIKMGELQLLPLMYPALRLMFAEHCEEMEQKTARRQMRKELMSKF